MIDTENYAWSDLEKNKKACDTIRKDISTAKGIIADALNRYVKKKLGARSKKIAADMKLMFADLEIYESETDIQNAYGFGCIDEKEYDRLTDLWRKRETFVDRNGRYADRVTDLVKGAMNGIGEEYLDFLTETEEADRICKQRKLDIEKENIRLEYERRYGGNA